MFVVLTAVVGAVLLAFILVSYFVNGPREAVPEAAQATVYRTSTFPSECWRSSSV